MHMLSVYCTLFVLVFFLIAEVHFAVQKDVCQKTEREVIIKFNLYIDRGNDMN